MNRNNSNKQSKRLPSKVIYIGNLNYKISEKELCAIFSRYSKVGKIDLVLDPKTKKSKGIAFVEVFGEKEANKAINDLDGSSLDGRQVKVSIAKDRFAQETAMPISRAEKNEEKNKHKKKETPLVKRKPRRGLALLFENTSARGPFSR